MSLSHKKANGKKRIQNNCQRREGKRKEDFTEKHWTLERCQTPTTNDSTMSGFKVCIITVIFCLLCSIQHFMLETKSFSLIFSSLCLLITFNQCFTYTQTPCLKAFWLIRVISFHYSRCGFNCLFMFVVEILGRKMDNFYIKFVLISEALFG